MEVKPFKGYRYDKAVTGSDADCISPPYDVIHDEMREDLYNRNPHNIVHIIRGKSRPDDTDTQNKYTRAASYLNEWITSGALKQDENDTIYAYLQDFEVDGHKYTRSAFVALGRLAEFGKGVQPHEKTLDGPRADRLKLMRATAAQFGQVFMLYDDPQKTADAVIEKATTKHPLFDWVDHLGVRHHLYPIADPMHINAIVEMMADKQPIIADGHHRYETALQYWQETGNPGAAHRMMTFVNMRNEGLIILPTHRLMSNVPDFEIECLLDMICEHFKIEPIRFSDDESKCRACGRVFDNMKSLFQQDKHAFGIYAGGDCFYTLCLKDPSVMDQYASQLSDATRALDVNVLHKLILECDLHIDDAQLASQSNLEYIKGVGDAVLWAIEKVDSGQAQAVFFMNPTRIEHVQAVAAAGEKMPQKSTFFYPKIWTGLVINKL